MANVVSDFLGKYRVIDEIGRGRFSIIYRAEHPFLKKTVVVKLMRTDIFKGSEITQQLLDGIRKTSSIIHENISTIHDIGIDENQVYIVTDFFPGGNLYLWKNQQKHLGFLQISRLILECAEALDHIHSIGFIHGDIKPGNILITENGKAKLTDIGILNSVGSSGAISSDLSRSTPQYLSPEQAEGGNPTQFSDQYSLGIIAYELFTGNPPFLGATTLSIYLKHVREVPVSISQLNPLATPQVDAVIQKCLNKNPGDRYPDCQTFAKALLVSVQASEINKYNSLIQRINPALAIYDLATVRPLIDAALQVAPDEKATLDLLNNLQKHEVANQQYQNAHNSLNLARNSAKSLRNLHYPTEDTQNLLPRLAPLPMPLWRGIVIRLRTALFLAMTLGIIGILLGIAGTIYTSYLPSGNKEKATIVALARTSTPIPPTSTATATLTFTPTLTITPTATLTPIPTYVIGSTTIREKDGMEMVFVPAGKFSMGSKLGQDDEVPVHTVDLSAFWIDQTEITNKMYAQCEKAHICRPPSSIASFTRNSYYDNPEFSAYPVINVDWTQAKDYCGWAGGRLPNEAEWEKAARGTDARIYPWGDEIDLTYANYFGGPGDTEKVGSYSLGDSPYGAKDMAGNVWEWVSSQYKLYPYDKADGRENLKSDGARVLRGGSFYYHFDLARSSYRYWENPSRTNVDIGFRCVFNILH